MVRKIDGLKKGDKVGIVAPSAIFNREKFRAGIQVIKEMGLVPVLAPDIFKKDFIFSGTLEQRRRSFMTMARRDDLKALWCVRGGYGAYELGQILADEKVPSSPKVLLGMSDITALHLLLMQKWKWPGLHSPLVDRLGNKESGSREKKVVQQTLLKPDFRLHLKTGLKSLAKKTVVEGIVTGSNLATLVSSLKTKWEVDTRGKILFLEDVGERAYRLDRMFFNLQAAGKFDHVKAVVFGDFTGCVEPDGRELWKTLFKKRFAGAPFPVLTGIPSGHGSVRLTIPMGVKARVKTTGACEFEILEGFSRG